ncbi:glycerophosphodiester phosphodiesterase [bacterium AH-315-K03]|nr:glycerophosphodiester phosphodiesterase [bacterium AH-315-K03]
MAEKNVKPFSAYEKYNKKKQYSYERYNRIQLGPRPLYLVNDMDDGALKKRLQQCVNKKPKKTDFSIAHRGAPLQFPEHTKESYVAAVNMGAGIVECDVTFTKDKQLVCRHSQCDLHTTSNILETELAQQCSQAFQAASYDGNGNLISPASARCCTSDITLAEFKTLKGKMDAANTGATTVQEYMNATANWRTDLYAGRGTLLSHKESIALFKELNVKMTPELKSPAVFMPYEGFTQAAYAQKMIDEYKEANVPAARVWPQSFSVDDVLYWIDQAPEFGQQAVYLDGRYDDASFDHRDGASWSPSMAQLVADGVNIIAPPLWMLLEVEEGTLVPSTYAKAAKAAGLDIIAWSFERAGPLSEGGGWYYQTVNGVNQDAVNPEDGLINNDGDIYNALDVLAKDVGVLGVFSDWPATVSYYASCMHIK